MRNLIFRRSRYIVSVALLYFLLGRSNYRNSLSATSKNIQNNSAFISKGTLHECAKAGRGCKCMRMSSPNGG